MSGTSRLKNPIDVYNQALFKTLFKKRNEIGKNVSPFKIRILVSESYCRDIRSLRKTLKASFFITLSAARKGFVVAYL